MKLILSLLAILFAATLGAAAEPPPGNADLGHALAQRWCANCHLISPGGPNSVATDAVPTFVAIAHRPSSDYLTLQAFLEQPHPPMPDFALTNSNIQNLVAYILSLSGQAP